MGKLNKFTIKEGVIYFDNGLVIDEFDLYKLKGRKPYVDKHGYPRIKYKNKSIKIHRLILGIDNSSVPVDHVDGNRLNNRRYNLRVSDNQLNSRNRSNRKDSKVGYKGVTITKEGNYMARIQIDLNKRLCLGRFSTPEEAALTYDFNALKYFGNFARFNFPYIMEEFIDG